MIEIDIPGVLAELVDAFEAYEAALVANDIERVNAFFWHGPQVVRFGTRENERQYGYAEITEARRRRGPLDQRRILRNRRITTWGEHLGVATVEYIPAGSDKVGRQSQTWLRTNEGWKIVSAHVSFGI